MGGSIFLDSKLIPISGWICLRDCCDGMMSAIFESGMVFLTTCWHPTCVIKTGFFARVCFYSLLPGHLRPRPRDPMHHLRLIQVIAFQATGSYQPDRGIFRHLETRTVCPIPSSLICPLLPSGIYACFFYFSDHWAPASLKLIESETCLPKETLTLSIKEISDFILSIRSKDSAHVFNTDTFGARKLQQ